MSQGFGPFSVDPAQVAGLGGAVFQNLVNRLLDAEVASAHMFGSDLRTSYQDNVADQGVDAGIYAANQTEWIPTGDSAWQFKAGDLGPKACADELEGATRAREIVESGGKYRIVLGKGLEDHKIKAREAALRKKAGELGYDASGDNFKVLDGNQLARWIERYPQLAVSTLLGGTGNVAIAFDKWRQSGSHQSTYVASAERDELRSTVRTFLEDTAVMELRIEGASGLGKTRGVMEALAGSAFEPLVMYVGDDADLKSPLIDHLTGQNRAAVIIIDECTRKRHNVLAQQLQVGAHVKLITIGEAGSGVPQSAPLILAPLPDAVIDDILKTNKASLWPEARRVVVAHCAGNVRWALYVADMVLKDPTKTVGSPIDASALQLLVGDLLSGEEDFLALSALSLFSRYGVARDKRVEIELIAAGLDIPVDDLIAANQKLERLGLVARHGRYRSVAPQPVAIYLARQAWEYLGDKIVANLLPILDERLSEQLFLRAADLGSTGPAAVALNRILGPVGPFSSLESLQVGGASRLLIQLAIVSPEEVANHLTQLLKQATDGDLRNMKSIRRDLVWTLEKLAWHSATFDLAADMLLRLAIAENETWSNNATGTWVGLFGAMLPATATRPARRIDYLQGLISDPNEAVRGLACQAARSVIDVRGGSVMISGELQGGVVVEPRGTPETYGELWDYVRSGIGMLRTLVADPDAEVRAEAEKTLVSAIHPMLENVAVRDVLFDTLAVLPAESLRKVRTEIKHLYALFANVEKPDFIAATNSEPDVANRRAGLDVLSARLPEAEPIDELTSLAFAQRWEWEDGELGRAINDVVMSMAPEEAEGSLLRLLSGTETPEASFELGLAMYAVSANDRTVTELSRLAESGNLAAIVGYLHASVKDGQVDAFDAFLDGPVGQELEPETRLVLTVRGPKSDAGRARLIELMRVLPVHVGAPRMFGWHVDVEEQDMIVILDEWLSKIDSQLDYNYAIDVVSMMVHRRPQLNPDVEARISSLVELRSQFPDVGQESWDWAQLARRQITTDADSLLRVLLRQADAGSLHAFEGSEEQELLRQAIGATGKSNLDYVLGLVKKGSWRIQMDLRGWLADLYESSDVIAWIGDDVERARVVASLTSVGDGEPSAVVRHLLSRFGSDDEVSSTLYGDFVSGTWWGDESERLNGQISQLKSWVVARDEPPEVKAWATKIIASLKRRLAVVLEEEAEERR